VLVTLGRLYLQRG